MKMKRLFALLLALALFMSVAALSEGAAEEPAGTTLSLGNALGFLGGLLVQAGESLEQGSGIAEDSQYACEIQSLHHFAGEENGLKLVKLTATQEDDAFAMEFTCSYEGFHVVAAYVHALAESGDFHLNDEFCGKFYTEEDTNGDGVKDQKANYMYAAALEYTGSAEVNGHCSVHNAYGEDMEGHLIVTVDEYGSCCVRAVYDLYMGDCGLRYDADMAEPIHWKQYPVPESYVQAQSGKGSASTDSQDSEGVEQAQAASGAAQAAGVSGDSTQVQDLYSFAGHAMSFESISTNSSGCLFRKFSGGADDLDILKAYVRLLDEGDYPFALNNVHDEYYGGSTWMYSTSTGSAAYYSATLNYTGTGRGVGDRIEQVFEESDSGNIMLYCTIENNSMQGYMYISKGLEFEDLGLRSDGSVVQLEKAGQSSDSALSEEADGVYATADGRLRTTLGQCMILRDGEAFATGEVSLTRNPDSGWDEFRIYNFYRNEGIAFTVPSRCLMTGDELTAKEMGINGTLEEYVSNMDGFFGFTPNYKFGLCHGGDYLFAYPDPVNDLRQLQIRVLKWDEGEKLAVVYIACRFDTAPFELEALAAMPIQEGSGRQDVGDQSGTGSMTIPAPSGKTRTICSNCRGNKKVKCGRCDGNGYYYHYELGQQVKHQCDNCHGHKVVDCSNCGGTGYVER